MTHTTLDTGDRDVKAFFWVPLVAAGAWYLLMLARLLVADGWRSLGTDVVAMGAGGILIGLPVALLITLLLGGPAYWLARRTVGVSLASAIAGGAMVGLISALGYWLWAGDWMALSPVRGPMIGAASAAVWWCLRGGRAAAS